MIKQTAIVTDADDGIAHVKVQRESTCGQCQVQKGCGTSVFSKVLGNKHSVLKVLNPINAETGDIVILGLHESVLIKSALLMYLFPLCMMFLGGIAILLAEKWLNIDLSQIWVIAGSIVGLVIAFLFIRKINRRFSNDKRFQPVILSKASLSEIKLSPFNVEVK